MPTPATLHLLLGPAGSGKTASLLDHARALLRHDPGGVLWVAPTRRALDELRGRIARMGGICGLRLLTFADLSEQVHAGSGPATRAVSAAQRRLLVEEVVADLAARRDLEHFGPVCDTTGFIESLLSFLRELEHDGVNAAELVRATDGPEAARKLTGQKNSECAQLFARYLSELQQQGLHDPEGREASAAEVITRDASALDGVRAIFVDGFSDFTPGQHLLLERLHERVEEMWISLPDEEGDERAELFQGPRHTRQRLASMSPRVEHSAGDVSETPEPVGLAHLRGQLFRPLRGVKQSHNPEGLELIEAPGILGEVRLVARRIKKLLLSGIPASEILIVARDIGPYADLLREVFAEYGLPLEVEGSDSLLRQPAVAFLLRALRLPEDDFPFTGVTATLRHTFFRPGWPEVAGAADLPQQAEVLLRLLGEPRGRDAYLAAVERWAEREQPGLEDEAAEESRRKRIHELAKACRVFLVRFFRAWDGSPQRAPLDEHVAWLRLFADDLGIQRAAGLSDQAALDVLWGEVRSWVDRPGCAVRVLDRRTFLRRLTALAGSAGMARSPGGPGRLRALSAPQARHLQSDYRFVLGLGERGFPRLRGEPSLLDETDREAFARAGSLLPVGNDELAEEMLLFYQVVAGTRQRLVLSYPAVDERGQEMLPGSFLLTARSCFVEDVIPRESRTMLLARFLEDDPLSPAEYRVRVAAAWPAGSRRLGDDLRAALNDAAALVRARFDERTFGPHDGVFRDPLLIEWVGKQFGPQKIFSPTALENYVACPFRFFLQHVLKQEPLEEPAEEIEVTRRGMAFHRALARLHGRLKEAGIHGPTEEVKEHVLREISMVIDEDVARAPSPPSKELWRLEGQRMLRVAEKYPEHWSKFREPWLKRGVEPRPYFFEVDFGLQVPEGQVPQDPLVIRIGETEVRISGRIDRVDLAQLDDGMGYWVIDYKTGRASHYTGIDLAQFRRLQLTLYALAVEEVLLGGRGARPLGMAYWLVSENGPKMALPVRNAAQWLEDAKRWPAIREQLREWVAKLVGNIRHGAFPLAPRSEQCTQTCPYGQVCRISQARAVGKTWDLPLPGTGE